jgi:hypothetical protein
VQDLRRRDAVRLILAGVPIVVWGCEGVDEPSTQDGVIPEDAEAVAQWLGTFPARDDVADMLRQSLAEGWTAESVFAGCLLYGARHVDSAYGGGAFHAVMQVEALRYFRRAGGEADVVPILLHGIFATFQAYGDGFALPAVDLGTLPAVDDADALLVQSVDGDDVETAMKTCVALHRAGENVRLHEALLELGPRRTHKLGHEAICTAKVLSVLRDLPGDWREDVYRCVVWALMTRDQPRGPENTELWQSSRERAMTLPESWAGGSSSDDRVIEVADALREVTEADAALDVIAQLLESSIGAVTLWDGLILAAVESVYAGSNYHALTAMQALRDGYRLATTDRVRLLLLLQAGVFTALEHAAAGVALPLAELAPQPATLDEVFAGDRHPGFLRAFGHLQLGGEVDAFVQRVRQTALMRSYDHHHFKIPHAALLEAEAFPKRFVPHLLAATRFYAPSDDDPLSDPWNAALD